MAETSQEVVIFCANFFKISKWEGTRKLFSKRKLNMSQLVCLTSKWESNYHMVSNLASSYEFLCEKMF